MLCHHGALNLSEECSVRTEVWQTSELRHKSVLSSLLMLVPLVQEEEGVAPKWILLGRLKKHVLTEPAFDDSEINTTLRAFLGLPRSLPALPGSRRQSCQHVVPPQLLHPDPDLNFTVLLFVAAFGPDEV